jgi:parvulin-like peptidyl-prolyl isomerase
MPRATTAVIVAGLILGASFFAFRSARSSRVPERPPETAMALSAASVTTEPAPIPPAPSVSAPPTPILPDGRQVEGLELPDNAPARVSFGVVLVSYRGAEDSPGDAPSKDVALQKAKDLASLARASFDEAVKKGDKGSTAEAGTMPRGVLDPALEYVLFTLKKGQVYGEPIDTPRGYWILRRNE